MGEDVKKAGATHDVHGVTHAHPSRRVGAQLYAPKFRHIGALTNCLIQNGTTSLHQDFGNDFSETFQVAIGQGFHCVNVQLSGRRLVHSQRFLS